MTQASWVADRQAARLPVPSCHGVFPLPHALTARVLGNNRPLRTRLVQATSQTRLQGGRQHRGGHRGGLPILPPWAQPLGAHCHGHCRGPGAALGAPGTRWGPPQPRVVCPVPAVRPVFRGKCLAALLCRPPLGPWVGPEAPEPLATPEGGRRFLAQRYPKAWSVDATQALGGPGPVLDSLRRSPHRVAIAKHRLVEVQDGPGRLPSRHRRPGNRGQPRPLEAPEGLRRVRLPMVPQRVPRLRPLGCLATRGKARALRQGRPLRHQPPAPPTRPVQRGAAWRWQWTGPESPRGPECG